MKKICLGLFAACLFVCNFCSAEWVYVGDYQTSNTLTAVMHNSRFAYNLLQYLEPWDGNRKYYYQLYYDDATVTYYTNGSPEGETPPFVRIDLDTLLVPVSEHGARNLNSGEIYDKLSVHNGGAFTIEVLRHTVQYTERWSQKVGTQCEIVSDEADKGVGFSAGGLTTGSPVTTIIEKIWGKNWYYDLTHKDDQE